MNEEEEEEEEKKEEHKGIQAATDPRVPAKAVCYNYATLTTWTTWIRERIVQRKEEEEEEEEIQTYSMEISGGSVADLPSLVPHPRPSSFFSSFFSYPFPPPFPGLLSPFSLAGHSS